MLLSLPPYIISYWVVHFHGVHCKSASVQFIANCCALLVSRGYDTFIRQGYINRMPYEFGYELDKEKIHFLQPVCDETVPSCCR